MKINEMQTELATTIYIAGHLHFHAVCFCRKQCICHQQAYIMEPYPFKHISGEKIIFNYRLSRTSIVENAIDIGSTVPNFPTKCKC